MNLSKQERLILWNQYEILKALHFQDESTSYDASEIETFQTALMNGYSREYDELVCMMSDDMSIGDCNFVYDVLSLYRNLYDSYQKFTAEEKSKIDITDIKYKGFDGNEETAYKSYADFILKDKEQYAEIYDNGKYDSDSHCNMLSYYRRLLEKFEKITDRKYVALSFKQVKSLLN